MKKTDNLAEEYDNEKPVEHIQCRNENLEGKVHPETGVPFERQQVEVDGKQYEVVVPQFDSQFDAQLPEDKLKSTDREQFKECNAQLKEEIAKSSDLRDQFDNEQIEQIENGHTGGRSIWGGGTDNR